MPEPSSAYIHNQWNLHFVNPRKKKSIAHMLKPESANGAAPQPGRPEPSRGMGSVPLLAASTPESLVSAFCIEFPHKSCECPDAPQYGSTVPCGNNNLHNGMNLRLLAVQTVIGRNVLSCGALGNNKLATLISNLTPVHPKLESPPQALNWNRDRAYRLFVVTVGSRTHSCQGV